MTESAREQKSVDLLRERTESFGCSGHEMFVRDIFVRELTGTF